MTGKHNFATLSKERQLQIAAEGGRSVPKYKRTFRKNKALARAAGRKGGSNVPAEKRAFSCDHALAKRAGCLGGKGARPRKRPFASIPGLARRAGQLGRQARAAKAAETDPSAQPL